MIHFLHSCHVFQVAVLSISILIQIKRFYRHYWQWTMVLNAGNIHFSLTICSWMWFHSLFTLFLSNWINRFFSSSIWTRWLRSKLFFDFDTFTHQCKVWLCVQCIPFIYAFIVANSMRAQWKRPISFLFPFVTLMCWIISNTLLLLRSYCVYEHI